MGIAVLFEDLQRMVAQSKMFNAANPHHLPWRLADMMGMCTSCAYLDVSRIFYHYFYTSGKAIYRLKVTLAEKRDLLALQSSVQQDHEEDQQLRSEAAAMEV